MVSPINGENPLASPSERLGESAKNSRQEQRVASPTGSEKPATAEPAGETPTLDQARQLFELENQAARPASEKINTPEAARSLLDQILTQIGNNPEQAVKAQGSVSSPLANLLQTSPV
jgi:hypothetical protein